MEGTDTNHQAKFNRPIFIVLGILFLFSCDSALQSSNQEEQKDQIVLMLEDSMVGDFLAKRKGSFMYIDDELFSAKIEFSGDSLSHYGIIKTKRGFLELVYQENSQNRFSYLFQKGDTVLIKLNEQNIWMETVNRRTSSYETNLELLRNRDLYQSTYTKLQDFYLLWKSNYASFMPVELKEELKQYRKEAVESLNLELSWIDSLRTEKSISPSLAEFYTSKARFELNKLNCFGEEDGAFDARGAFRLFLGSEWDTQEGVQTIYLHDFADFLLSYELLHHPIPSKSSPFVTNASTPFGKQMLFSYLNQTLPYLPFEEAANWLTSYENSLANQAQAKFLRTSFEALKNQRPDLDLMGLGKSTTTLEELLVQKKGKYLYIDFWAAWCIPCIQSFPASIALHDKYKEREFEVIYLSIDKNHKYWEDVVEKYQIAIPNRSFIVQNLEESMFLEKLKVDVIPRYLFFDQEGKLIHPYAPSPNSDEIRVFLEELIQK
ncbi:TlpA disulfide reductase family protein [Algoriphagus confluentis]|uniref:Thioredoxin domain-containing protein n=1 Tax=Algoriphagus confluentis TaxID=1697556 RepID=A0ABQ6PTV5_9BACT|nr:hypothetical protein Aconfl_39960 [Algoriphagus confluentis]